jgi:hypothetical protein
VKSIQIRDVPEEVHASPRAKAATAGLSLSEYLLREATKIASLPPMSEVLKRASNREWGSLRAKPSTLSGSCATMAAAGSGRR